VIPWVIVVVVVVVLVGRYSVAGIGHQLARPGTLAVLATVFVTSIGSLLVLAVTDHQLIPITLGAPRGHISRWAFARGRAAAYMLVGVHEQASAGGYGIWLARTSGADVRTTLSTMFYVGAADVAAASMITLLASAIGGEAIRSELTPLAVMCAAIALGPILVAGLLGRRLLRTRVVARWVRTPYLVAAWARVSAREFAIALSLRTVNVLLTISGQYVAARAFGIQLSFLTMVAIMPMLGVVMALPVNVGGVGAVQLAWITAFGRWAPGESILALQLAMHWSLGVSLMVRGFLFAPRVFGEIMAGRRGSARAGAADASAARATTAERPRRQLTPTHGSPESQK
jgi:hypothetical protein